MSRVGAQSSGSGFLHAPPVGKIEVVLFGFIFESLKFVGFRIKVIGCRKEIAAERRAHPPCLDGKLGLKAPLTHPIQLRTRPKPCPHQLNLIHHPEAVVVEEGEMHGPAVAGHAVAAVEGAGEEHVLGADEDGGLFGVEIPFPVPPLGDLSPHENDDAGQLLEEAMIVEPLHPLPHFALGLFHQRPHGQAVDEATGPRRCVFVVGGNLTIPKPGEDHAGGLAEAGGDIDQPRGARSARVLGLR